MNTSYDSKRYQRMLFSGAVIVLLITSIMLALVASNTYAANIRVTSVVYSVQVGETSISQNVIGSVEEFDQYFEKGYVYIDIPDVEAAGDIIISVNAVGIGEDTVIINGGCIIEDGITNTISIDNDMYKGQFRISKDVTLKDKNLSGEIRISSSSIHYAKTFDRIITEIPNLEYENESKTADEIKAYYNENYSMLDFTYYIGNRSSSQEAPEKADAKWDISGIENISSGGKIYTLNGTVTLPDGYYNNKSRGSDNTVSVSREVAVGTKLKISSSFYSSSVRTGSSSYGGSSSRSGSSSSYRSNSSSRSSSEYNPKDRLFTPSNLIWCGKENTVAKWDKVPEADRYNVSIIVEGANGGGITYYSTSSYGFVTTDETSVDLKNNLDMIVDRIENTASISAIRYRVKAICNDSTIISDSEWSDYSDDCGYRGYNVIGQLSAPVNLRWSGENNTIAEWDAVDNTGVYYVVVHADLSKEGTSQKVITTGDSVSTNETSIDLKQTIDKMIDGISSPESINAIRFQVRAYSKDISAYKSSPLSAESADSGYRGNVDAKPLDIPQNLRWSGQYNTVAAWDEVQNASNYTVSVYAEFTNENGVIGYTSSSDSTTTTTGNSLDLRSRINKLIEGLSAGRNLTAIRFKVKANSGDITVYKTSEWSVFSADSGYRGGVYDNDTPIDGVWIKGVKKVPFDGTKQTQDLKVYDGTTLLSEKIDYTVSYKNNKNAYIISDPKKLSAEDKKKAPQVIITMKGNYGGKETAYFSITPISITDNTMFSAYIKNSGQKKTPVLTWNGKVLKVNRDYTVSVAGNTATFIGKGNFTGIRTLDTTTASVPIQIAMSKTKVISIPPQVYTGTAYSPESLKTKDGKPLKLTVSYGTENLTEGIDYRIVKITNPTKAGTANLVLKGLNAGGTDRATASSFVGEKRVSFKITGYPITGKMISFTNKTGETLFSADFHKSGAKPELIVKYDGRKLIEDIDYTLKYTGNTQYPATNASVTVIGRGNFSGKKTILFSVNKRDFSNYSGITVIAADKAVGKKSNQYKTSVKVFDSEGKLLKAGKDYEKDVVYMQNGTRLTESSFPKEGEKVTVIVTGRGGYSNSYISTEYKILPTGTSTDIAKAAIKIKNQDYNRDKAVEITSQSQFQQAVIGKDKTVIKLSTDDGKTGDFMVMPGSYLKNDKKGTAKVTLIGINGYSGAKTVSFKIGARSVLDIWKGLFS